MSKLTAQEADEQITLDGSFRAKHDGAKVVIQGHGRIFDEYAAKFRELADKGEMVVKEELVDNSSR